MDTPYEIGPSLRSEGVRALIRVSILTVTRTDPSGRNGC